MTEITPDVTIEVQEEEIKTPKQVDELNQTTDFYIRRWSYIAEVSELYVMKMMTTLLTSMTFMYSKKCIIRVLLERIEKCSKINS